MLLTSYKNNSVKWEDKMMTITEVSILALFILLAGGFISLALWATFSSNNGITHKDIMDWDFRGCEQMREAGWPEEEIAELMRRPGNYYDKDYEND